MSKSVCVKDNPVAFNKHWVHVTSSSYLSLTVVPTSKCMLIITDTIATIIFSPHGIAMLKGLYFTAVVFSSFFWRVISWGHWTDLSQTWKHTHLWLLFEKFGPNSPGHLPPIGWGQINDFWDRLWTLTKHISATEHDINNRKETCQSTGTPLHAPKFENMAKFVFLTWTLVQKRLRTLASLVSIFTISINSKSFPCAVHSVQETYPHCRQCPMSDIG